MKRRWVGLGVIADNLVNISRATAKQPRRLNRSRYRGEAGMKRRWVGLGVIADNLVNISRATAKQPRPVSRAFCPQKLDTFVG